MVILNCSNNLQYLCIFYQINAVLVRLNSISLLNGNHLAVSVLQHYNSSIKMYYILYMQVSVDNKC